MRTRLAYILLWLLPGLLILGLMAYYYKQLNRSERHLARKLRYLSVSDNFRYGQKILPAIHAWRKPENPLLFKEFFTLGRGYVYQSDKEFSDYLKNFGPDARNTYLQAVRRVLLSPASEELKDRYRKGALLHLEPDAFISIPSNGLKRPRHEFYWVEAVDSDEGAFEWWQDKTPILQEAKDSGLIEDYRHLAFLAVAPESVTGRYERLKDEADEAVITIGLREQAASQGIDRRLFRHEEGRLEKSGWILKEPLTVAEQFSRWRELGVTNLLQNYIIPRENGGYWAGGPTLNFAMMGVYETAYGDPYHPSSGESWNFTQLKLKGKHKNCVHARGGDCGLRNDEILFYDEGAMCLKYVVEFNN